MAELDNDQRKQMMRALSDPGSILPRDSIEWNGSTAHETVLSWQLRAVDAVAAPWLAAPSGLCDRVQQARNDYYEQAVEHGEMSSREHWEREERAYGRVEMCDEVLGWLAGTPAPGEKEATP